MISSINQMTSFRMKHNTGLKWVKTNTHCLEAITSHFFLYFQLTSYVLKSSNQSHVFELPLTTMEMTRIFFSFHGKIFVQLFFGSTQGSHFCKTSKSNKLLLVKLISEYFVKSFPIFSVLF